MGILKIDVSNTDELLTKKTYDPVPPGKYLCEVANDLKTEKSKSSDNEIIKVELVVIDDGDFKGKKIFDILVLGATAETRKNCEWKIAHFAVACGVCTKDTLGEIDLDNFKGQTVEVDVGVKTEEYLGEIRKKNFVKGYLFESPDE